MKQCDYFACTDEIDETDSKGFNFCCYHLQCLQQVIAIDLLEEGKLNSLGYCLSALNSKAYFRSSLIL